MVERNYVELIGELKVNTVRKFLEHGFQLTRGALNLAILRTDEIIDYILNNYPSKPPILTEEIIIDVNKALDRDPLLRKVEHKVRGYKKQERAEHIRWLYRNLVEIDKKTSIKSFMDFVEELGRVKDKTEAIMRKFPRSRDDDRTLVLLYWYYIDLKNFDMVNLDDLTNVAIRITVENIMDLTPESTIRRMRAFIQYNDNRLLPTNPEIYFRRKRVPETYGRAIETLKEV